jgi:hypothetical protein
MNKKMVASLSMLLLPWLTVPFLGKSFFRFLPAATFVNLFITVLSVIANRKKWYINKNPLFPNVPIDFTYILGPHFVATLWMFKLTYGSFLKYLIANIVFDWINAFPFAGMWKRMGFFKFKKMSPSMYWCITVLLAIVIYGYQYTVEKVVRNVKAS